MVTTLGAWTTSINHQFDIVIVRLPGVFSTPVLLVVQPTTIIQRVTRGRRVRRWPELVCTAEAKPGCLAGLVIPACSLFGVPCNE
jgi:hypothetical protein